MMMTIMIKWHNDSDNHDNNNDINNVVMMTMVI